MCNKQLVVFKPPKSETVFNLLPHVENRRREEIEHRRAVRVVDLTTGSFMPK